MQGNKTGFLYILNRETGEPASPIEERPVPRKRRAGRNGVADAAVSRDAAGRNAATAISRPGVGSDAADRDACRTAIRDLRNDGVFTPPSVRGRLLTPGTPEGMTWSG